jgi:hypothetical protein
VDADLRTGSGDRYAHRKCKTAVCRYSQWSLERNKRRKASVLPMPELVGPDEIAASNFRSVTLLAAQKSQR